jgi:hypothetical protein
MESPAKRRKKNDQKPSPLGARSLDFFFAKQNSKATKGSNSEEVEATASAGSRDNGRHLTDEELARKLHDEWAKEDRLSDEQPPTIEDKSPLPSGLTVPANDGKQHRSRLLLLRQTCSGCSP